MTETVMQHYIQEQRVNRKITFEERRPPIFTLDKPLPPDQIKTVLQSYVEKTISQCKKIEKGSSFLSDDTIVLRMPDDAHLIPLMEPMIFQELAKYSKINSPGKYTDSRALMFVDPKLNTLEVDGVKGETLLMHELRHHLSDGTASTTPSVGMGGTHIDRTDDYIALKFFQQGKNIHYVGYYIPDPTTLQGMSKGIDSDMGPLSPANNDLIRAARAYSSLPVSMLDKVQTLFETVKVIAGVSDKLTSQWHMGNKLMSAWKKVRPELTLSK